GHCRRSLAPAFPSSRTRPACLTHERSRRDQAPLTAVAELVGDVDRVTNLDRLCVSVGIFPRHTEIGGLFTIHRGWVYVVALHVEPLGFSSWHHISVAALKISAE